MTDRFSAQLRQHLLDNANERPADGQLAAVIDAVEATKQRHPLAARLAWSPGRIGPFPSAALRYGLIALALALATVAGAILAGGGGRSPSTVFEGSWITIDPTDRSGMSLVVGPGMAPAVYFEDGYASGDACVNDTVKRFTARGTGTIEGNRLVVAYPDGGGCGLMAVKVGGRFDYLPGSDSLVDQDDLAWTRPLGEARPTRDPVAPTASPLPTTSPLPVGETFTSTVHGISIQYPDGWQTRPASEPWSGEALSFDSPAADVIFDPARGDGLYLLIASQPYGDLTEDEWRSETMDGLCANSGGSVGSWNVDGARAWAFTCGPVQTGLFVFMETRGYLLRVVASTAEPGLAETYDWDWLRPLLETVDLLPEMAVDEPQP